MNKEVICLRIHARKALFIIILIVVLSIMYRGSVYNPIPAPNGEPRQIMVPDEISINYCLAQSDVWEFTEHYYNTIFKVHDLLSEPANIIASMNYSEYQDHFGLIPDAEAAAKVAIIVHHETHEGCVCCERMIVGFNETANAWIVSGDPIVPDGYDYYGGSVIMALLKSTGQVILLYHNK